MMRSAKPLLLVAMIVVTLIAAATLPIVEWLTVGATWIDSNRTLSWSLYIVAYIIATALALPVAIFSLVGGFLFGLPVGVMIVSLGSVFGASGAFFIGRYLTRDWVAARIEQRPRFRALDKATRHDGFLIVLLARLSPLFPFNLMNYALALTSVRFRDYFIASWLGMLPFTIVYVYVGSIAADLTEATSGLPSEEISNTLVLFVGLVATIVLTILITRMATRTLNKHLEDDTVHGAAE